ncbi:YhcN/YlaJ family sporulation lipoprotein [Brevibacillus agri]|uniref:YhcN/YlaJ family sporulation lipoprotein n=1 Tax=Brevibacillus agri TaxID=51101 RepID=UPI00286FF398|nr:YhcN/YlaJ family sporulation lipoprotein [Brevibacillus agri]MDR9503347.1 YhcN/YlaJ family sporulation lipoprotein [Brevibacillus agri]
MRKNEPSYFTGLFLIAATLVGCASSNAGPDTGAQTQSSSHPATPMTRSSIGHDFNAYTQGINAQNYLKGYTSNGFNQDLAEQLTKAADDVPGVDRATVVVSGQDAVIGIRVRDNLGEPQAKVIEQQVHSACRAVSPTLQMQVSSDQAVFDRVRAINAQIYEEATNRSNQVLHEGTSVEQKITNTSTEFTRLLHDIRTTIQQPLR